KDPAVDDPGPGDVFRVGTVARVVQRSILPDRTCRVVLEGIGRVRISHLSATDETLRAEVAPLVEREAEAATAAEAAAEALEARGRAEGGGSRAGSRAREAVAWSWAALGWVVRVDGRRGRSGGRGAVCDSGAGL